MKICVNLVVLCMLVPTLVWGQQANVNLDYNPQKNTENLIPFSAPLNSPDVRDYGTVTFRLKAQDAKKCKSPVWHFSLHLDHRGSLYPSRRAKTEYGL